MHTARQLDQSLFEIRIGGRAASRDELLAGWDLFHRFGVVCHEPYGVIGASYLLQLAITGYYDARPQRRSRDHPNYPEVFVFHVGGRYGDHAYFDVYPPRKEVFVENDPAAVLEAINDRGITHLAVPDRPAETVKHGWKEPAQARDRLVAAWAYGPDGRVDDGEVTITTTSALAEANTKIALHPERSYHELQEAMAALGNITVSNNEAIVNPGDRGDEVPLAERDRIRDARRQLGDPAERTESYRRINTDEALGMLHRGSVSDSRQGTSAIPVTT